MKIVRAKLEIRAILSCLQAPNKVKTELLGKLSSDHFGHPPMNMAYRIIQKMMVKSAMDLPSLETFLESPDLTQETADILKAPTGSPITKVDDAKHLIDILEHYRVIRRFYAFSRETLATLQSATAVDLPELMTDMEQCLSDMRSDVDEVPLYHVGKGAKEENVDVLMEEVFSTDIPKIIPSTFHNFDSRTGGFGETDLFIPASHRKGGKSILTLNITSNMYSLNNVDVI
jgi:replicative DNA helicase